VKERDEHTYDLCYAGKIIATWRMPPPWEPQYGRLLALRHDDYKIFWIRGMTEFGAVLLEPLETGETI
jgi:hypothetical protein